MRIYLIRTYFQGTRDWTDVNTYRAIWFHDITESKTRIRCSFWTGTIDVVLTLTVMQAQSPKCVPRRRLPRLVPL